MPTSWSISEEIAFIVANSDVAVPRKVANSGDVCMCADLNPTSDSKYLQLTFTQANSCGGLIGAAGRADFQSQDDSVHQCCLRLTGLHLYFPSPHAQLNGSPVEG